MEPPPSDLDWVQLHKDMGSHVTQETARDKFVRKLAENPFVPIGCLATTGALGYGLWNLRNRHPVMSQNMMRLRIVAQGFTIVAILVGVVSNTQKIG